MNIVLDIGNTSAKVGLFDGTRPVELRYALPVDDAINFINGIEADHILIGTVNQDAGQIEGRINSSGSVIILSHETELPISLDYRTPETLGVDRIAAVVGSQQYFENENCLVIDMGTCITYDFIDGNKVFYGGGIAPGIRLKFKSLHHFTANLPLIEWDGIEVDLVGSSTESSILSGVINGTVGEINQIITNYKNQYGSIQVLLTGGDAKFFEKKLKGPIFVAQNLVLEGLNAILIHNA